MIREATVNHLVIERGCRGDKQARRGDDEKIVAETREAGGERVEGRES